MREEKKLRNATSDRLENCLPNGAEASRCQSEYGLEEVPNAATRAAMSELEAGNGKSFATVEGLMTDLNADD